MDITCLFWQFIWFLKIFATWYASSFVVTLRTFRLRLLCMLFTLRVIDMNFIFFPSDSLSSTFRTVSASVI
jgi:hypothetical protein